MKKILIIPVILLVASLAFAIVESQKADEPSEANKSNELPHPVIVTSAQGSSINLKIADNTDGKKFLTSLEKSSGMVMWRCLGMVLTSNEATGMSTMYTSLTMGGPTKWDGEGDFADKDPVRNLHHPANTCNVATEFGTFDARPLDGAPMDARVVNSTKKLLVNLFNNGYSRVFPKEGISLNTADIRTVPASTQVKRLKGISDQGTLLCKLNGEPKPFVVKKANSKDQIPEACELIVFSNKKETRWSFRPDDQTKMVIRHDF